MSRVIKIGTRDSQLALWQAKTVQNQLERLGYATQLIPVKSTGDLILDTPLYELGITGIFTKTLDVAMLNGSVDIAVHSMKDVPTALPIGIVQAAVLKRAATQDILVYQNLPDYEKPATVATGSLRRQAQWLHRYPHHKMVDLRGNVNTRLQKLKESDWLGAIFAKAGLERIAVLPATYSVLDWMVPAPAQGAMMIAALEKDSYTIDACAQLNHQETALCTHIERTFLRTLEGGCTAPIGASASLENGQIHFKGVLFSIDGQQKIEVDKRITESQALGLGTDCALEVLDNGGRELMKEIKKITQK